MPLRARVRVRTPRSGFRSEVRVGCVSFFLMHLAFGRILLTLSLVGFFTFSGLPLVAALRRFVGRDLSDCFCSLLGQCGHNGLGISTGLEEKSS